MQTTENWLKEIARDYDMDIDKVRRMYNKHGIRKLHPELEKLLVIEKEQSETS